MLRNVRKLYGYRVEGTDGPLGKIRDFYFDDQEWILRYLVLDASRLPGRRVPIATEALVERNWQEETLSANLSAEQVKNGPVVETDERPHPILRSTRRMTGLNVEANDGAVGSVNDFLFDDETWHIRYLVVDIGRFLAGKKVLVHPQWVLRTDWDAHTVHLDLAQESIRSSPSWDPDDPVVRDYETGLFAHYDRPEYWEG